MTLFQLMDTPCRNQELGMILNHGTETKLATK